MAPVVLARKPSGLALVRFLCGCEQWMRLLADGSVRDGRHARWCARGEARCASPDPGVRYAEATAHLRAVQEVSP